ncbi:unnamed protein product [Soboliphyme baturini]|uniref:Uncharacterized protein n=1 Tax=Soboliphyme baturini TaxID=241478 RepID=A0A183IF13_9BILA|nr:unnamed protein product [Soboliphyme baturini]
MPQYEISGGGGGGSGHGKSISESIDGHLGGRDGKGLGEMPPLWLRVLWRSDFETDDHEDEDNEEGS